MGMGHVPPSNPFASHCLCDRWCILWPQCVEWNMLSLGVSKTSHMFSTRPSTSVFYAALLWWFQNEFLGCKECAAAQNHIIMIVLYVSPTVSGQILAPWTLRQSLVQCRRHKLLECRLWRQIVNQFTFSRCNKTNNSRRQLQPASFFWGGALASLYCKHKHVSCG